jgi:hypothetical protein
MAIFVRERLILQNFVTLSSDGFVTWKVGRGTGVTGTVLSVNWFNDGVDQQTSTMRSSTTTISRFGSSRT